MRLLADRPWLRRSAILAFLLACFTWAGRPARALDVCDFLPPPLVAPCRAAGGVTQAAISFTSDPLGYMAQKFAESTVWMWGKIADVVLATTQVNFANPHFLQVYATVFGASIFVIVPVWLIMVIVRPARGVPVGKALGEAVGGLFAAIIISGLMPAFLYLANSLVDQITMGLVGGTAQDATNFLKGAGKLLIEANPSGPGAGGALLFSIMAILGLITGAIVWIELLLRGGFLYLGAVLAPIALVGLLDKSLWHITRKWLGLVVATLMMKPIIILSFVLVSALASSGSTDTYSAVFEALALCLVAIFASGVLFKFVPWAATAAVMHTSEARRHMAQSGPMAAVPGPASMLNSQLRSLGSQKATTAASVAGPATVAAAPVKVAATVGRTATAGATAPVNAHTSAGSASAPRPRTEAAPKV